MKGGGVATCGQGRPESTPEAAGSFQLREPEGTEDRRPARGEGPATSRASRGTGGAVGLRAVTLAPRLGPAPERAGGCPRGHGARAGAPAAHSPEPSTQALANRSHLPPARLAGHQTIRARPPAPSPSPESLSKALPLVRPTPTHGSREWLEDPRLWPPCPLVEHPAGALPELCPLAETWTHPIKSVPRPDGE